MTAAAVALACGPCGECGAPMRLRQGKYSPFWSCTRYPDCQGTHGAHPDGQPVGIPANKATKAARIRAHLYFDQLWEPKGKSRRARNAAYAWLGKLMGMNADECHIGKFTEAQCARVVRLVTRRLRRAGLPLPEEPR